MSPTEKGDIITALLENLLGIYTNISFVRVDNNKIEYMLQYTMCIGRTMPQQNIFIIITATTIQFGKKLLYNSK